MFFKKKQAQPDVEGFEGAPDGGVGTIPAPTGRPNLPSTATFTGGSLFANEVSARPANVDFGFGNFVSGGYQQQSFQPGYDMPPEPQAPAPEPLDWTPPTASAPAFDAPPVFEPAPPFEVPPGVSFEPGPEPSFELPPAFETSPAFEVPPSFNDALSAVAPPAFETPSFETQAGFPQPQFEEALPVPSFEPTPAFEASVPPSLDDFAMPAPGIENFSAPPSEFSAPPTEFAAPPAPYQTAFPPVDDYAPGAPLPDFSAPPAPTFDPTAGMDFSAPPSDFAAPAMDFSAPPMAFPTDIAALEVPGDPQPTGDYWNQVSTNMDGFAEPGAQVPQASGAQFLDNVNQQLYPDPSFAKSPLNDALGKMDVQDAEQALDEAATILFPEQYPAAPEPVAYQSSAPSYDDAFQSFDNDFSQAPVQQQAPLPAPDAGFESFGANFDQPQAVAAPAVDDGFASFGETNFSAPPDAGNLESMFYATPSASDFDAIVQSGAPEMAAPVTSVADLSQFEAPPQLSPDDVLSAAPPMAESSFEDDLFGDSGMTLTLDDLPDPLAMPAAPLPEPSAATDDVSLLFGVKQPSRPAEPTPVSPSAMDPSTWDINNMQTLGTCPLDRRRQLVVVRHDTVIALMADNGMNNASVLKVFANNPLASSNVFSAVKEGGVADKEMFYVTLGNWQAIVSADSQAVVLHTELSG